VEEKLAEMAGMIPCKKTDSCEQHGKRQQTLADQAGILRSFHGRAIGAAESDIRRMVFAC
jgi:hypothetical protein